MLTLSGLLQTSHAALRAMVREGDIVLDATAGNGHDTVFLAGLVGPDGLVLALDCQQEALAHTKSQLEVMELSGRVSLLCGEHSRMASLLSKELAGSQRSAGLTAAVFNLGFLPGSDKAVTTDAVSTRIALDAVWPRIRPGGLLSVHAYSGHPGANEEVETVTEWMRRLPWGAAQVTSCVQFNKPDNREVLFLVHKMVV